MQCRHMFVWCHRHFYKLRSYGTVEMVKQFPAIVVCISLTFRGDVVYIGSDACVIQWNVVTDAVVRLVGYAGLG